MNELTEKVEHLANSLELAHEEIRELKAKEKKSLETNKLLRKDVEDLKYEVNRLKKIGSQTDERLDYLSDQSRRDNLIFTQIGEDKDENWEQSEKKVMDFIGKRLNLEVKLERAHRTGQ